MADPKKLENPKPADGKPKKTRVEIAMRDLTPELSLKLAEYATLAANEKKPAPKESSP